MSLKSPAKTIRSSANRAVPDVNIITTPMQRSSPDSVVSRRGRDGSDDSAIATVIIEFSTEYPLGADILIESDDVHRYTGSGTNWSWVTDGAANVAVGGDIGELSVSRQLLGNPQDMRIYLLAVNTPYGGIGVRSLPRRSD